MCRNAVNTPSLLFVPLEILLMFNFLLTRNISSDFCCCCCNYNQMPRIWIDYVQFLMDQGKITRTRRTFDRALRALPITQHNRIWPIYLKFVRLYDLPETAVRVYRRHLKVMTSTIADGRTEYQYKMMVYYFAYFLRQLHQTAWSVESSGSAILLSHTMCQIAVKHELTA